MNRRQLYKKWSIASGVAVVLIAATIITITVFVHNGTADRAAKDLRERKLIFNDEFNGTSLDKTKWNTCYDNYSAAYKGCTNQGNFENEWYTDNGVNVANGNLVLHARKLSTKGVDSQGKEKVYDYTSGMVATGRYVPEAPAKWASSYGYFEARINAPEGKGIWPAFWLLPIDRDWPPEIDVMEILGDKPNEALTTYHWKGQDGQGTPQDSSTYVADGKLTGSWHVYAAEWRLGVIDWYIDGKLVKHFANDAVSGKQMQIILNLAVGGTLPGYPDETTPAEAKMLVDYVRVYE